MHRRSRSHAVAAALTGVVFAGLLAMPAVGAAAVNTSRFSLLVGNDFTTAYFFRGILQERDGLISQPYLELGAKLYTSEEGFVNSVTLFGGTWASIHSARTLNSGSGPASLYEQDWYGGIKMTTGPLEHKAAYYAITYPGGAFKTTQELDVTWSLNDSEWMGKFALYPWTMFVIETDKTALGPNEGYLWQVGVRPSFAIVDSESYPVTLAIPLTLSIGLEDYYELDENDDEAFGYAQGGLVASMPLAFVPEEWGAWSVSAGVSIYTFGDNLQAVNLDDDPWVVGTVGFSMTL